MKGLVVLGHPAADSFNAALARRVTDRLTAEGHDITFRDLYADRFDPAVGAEDLTREVPSQMCGYCDELANAEALVVVHPSWWGQPPAMLKGWVDRTFRAGVAYRFVDQGNGVGVPEGLLKADRALVLNTANSNPMSWGAADPLEEWWRNTVLAMCGIRQTTRRLYSPLITSTDEQRQQWLQDAEDVASEVFALQAVVG